MKIWEKLMSFFIKKEDKVKEQKVELITDISRNPLVLKDDVKEEVKSKSVRKKSTIKKKTKTEESSKKTSTPKKTPKK